MKLIALELSGFRRFEERVSIRLTESVVAVVGPNEAGKSALLRAISLLNDESAFDVRDRTRRVGVTAQITGTYELSNEDRDALAKAGVAEAGRVKRCRLIKKDDGKFTLELLGRERDRSSRREAATALESLIASAAVINFGKTAEEKADRKARFTAAVPILRAEPESLTNEQLHQIEQVAGEINSVMSQSGASQIEKDANAAFVKAVGELVKTERDWQPAKAQPIILRRKSRAVFFDDDSRNLKPNYEIGKVAANTPAALRNLSRVAGLNLDQLKSAAETGDLPVRTELTEQANQKLRDLFSQAWVQSDVVPQFQVEGGSLHLLVRTLDRGLCRFDERSDGLRWFVALVAFLSFQHQEGQTPILLVDEAETHLSYDAQASLMEVLEGQRVAEKVVYTTHSAGCLPSDLGTGIRAVQPLQGERSTIHNGFWKRGLGLSPIYLAMGLTPLAFTTARNAVFCEGPCECILLPTLVRQALKVERLDYQVAPGGANVDPLQLGDLVSECGRALFVVDGDAGGAAIREKLISAGISSTKIKSYADIGGTGFHLEDLVSVQAYCDAFNGELDRWQHGMTKITPADVTSPGRVDRATAWCERHSYKAPAKVTVCQRLAENAAEGAPIVDLNAVVILRLLHTWAMERFQGAV